MKKNFRNIFLTCLLFLNLDSAEAKPLDDFFAPSETKVTAALNDGVKTALSSKLDSSSAKEIGTSRKIVVLPKTGTIEAIVPKYDPSSLVKKVRREDTNRDGVVSPLDALRIINALNGSLGSMSASELDVNQDGRVGPIDVLLVINYLNNNKNRSAVDQTIVYPPSLIVLTDNDGGGDVQLVYDGDTNNLSTIKYNGLNINLRSGGADRLVLPYIYSATNDRASRDLLQIEIFSGKATEVSACKVPLPTTTTVQKIVRSEGELEVAFSSCTGKADFSNVGAIRVTVFGDRRGGMDFRIKGIRTNGMHISSAEDVSKPEKSVDPLLETPPCVSPCGCDKNGNPIPSGPCGCDFSVVDLGCGCGLPAKTECGCDPNNRNLGCGCGNPAPSGCDLQCGSTKTDLGCGCGLPARGECGCDLNIKNLGCGCGNPAPGKCGCEGTDVCGNCLNSPIPPGNAPNECGGCGPATKTCGFCPDDPNKKIDLGCGCGNPAPSGCDLQCGSTKTDLGCGCGSPGRSGCDNECGSTKVNNSCGMCGKAESECKICDSLYGVHINASVNGGSNVNYTDIVADTKARLDQSTNFGRCLAGKLDVASNVCNDIRKRGDQSLMLITKNPPIVDRLDDCIANYFTNSQEWRELREKYGYPDSPPREVYAGDCRYEQNTLTSAQCQAAANYSDVSDQSFRNDKTNCREHVRQSSEFGYSCWDLNRRSYIYGTDNYTFVFFNDNCEQVRYPGNKGTDDLLQCAAARMTYIASPISLVYDEKDSSKKNTIVKFSLSDLNCPSCYSEWRASKSWPLLVHDPEHKGQITSSIQLFGDWTFGGKQYSSLNTSHAISSKWENGYEALATMDSNKDGIVNGDELDSLALWFDENQNGISEQGEVRTLKEENISKLFFKNTQTVTGTKDVAVEVGYERSVNGQTIKGKSIDWYGTISNFPEEILAKTSIKGMSSLDLAEDDKSDIMSTKSEKSVSGIWKWEMVDAKDKGQKIGGYLILNDLGKDLKGYAMTEYDLQGVKVADIKSQGLLNSLKGSRVKGNSFEFKVENKDVSLTSTFSVAKNGEDLVGETGASTANGPLRYRWIAKKYR